MKLTTKTVFTALVLSSAALVTAQLAQAQSTGQTDCNNQKITSTGCPPIGNANPPPPVVTPIATK